MKILAIDPGTHCGYALSPYGSGTWDLSVKRHEGGGMRFVRLMNYLIEACNGVDLVVYEEVHRHSGTDAAHVYGGIIAVIQQYCELHEINYQGVPVGTIKLHATGKGNANKDAMVDAARANWPDIEIHDDNQADALWILDWAEKEYGSKQ